MLPGGGDLLPTNHVVILKLVLYPSGGPTLPRVLESSSYRTEKETMGKIYLTFQHFPEWHVSLLLIFPFSRTRKMENVAPGWTVTSLWQLNIVQGEYETLMVRDLSLLYL